MRFKVLQYLMVAFFAIVFLSACTSPKKIRYFQNIDDVTLEKIETAYQAVIKKDDRLAISVTGPDKSVTSPYNLASSSTDVSSVGGDVIMTYLVDPYGDIIFPILGRIHVEGMTRNQLVEYLTREIGKDVKDPIVNVAFKNYKITILGDVASPGTYTFDSEKTNILQALSRAGDLNITAKREDILLLREVNGEMVHYSIDLKDSHILDSPYFFMQQNDIIYVPPTNLAVLSGTSATGLWSLCLSIFTAAVAVLAIFWKP